MAFRRIHAVQARKDKPGILRKACRPGRLGQGEQAKYDRQDRPGKPGTPVQA